MDTNVYLDAAADASVRERFGVYVMEHGVPLQSSVVLAEIALGARKAGQGVAAARVFLASATPQAPSHEDWLTAAAAVARLEAGGSKSRSFWNDALLAAQCARLGCVLITSNRTDFERLQQEIPVNIALPFPG